MREVAIYARLSADEQVTNSKSIENQIAIAENYVKSLPEYKDHTVLIFKDNGYSGTNFDRPGVTTLLEKVMNYEVDCVVVKDFSRLARNMIGMGEIVEKVFPTYGTRFIAINEGFDTGNSHITDGVDVGFKYLMNEYYSKDISQKIKQAYKSKQLRAEAMSSNTAYGFIVEDKKITVDPETAPIVKMIFELSAKGYKVTQIKNELYKLKVETPSQRKVNRKSYLYQTSDMPFIWCTSTIRSILADERYLGHYVGGRYKVRNVGGIAHKTKKDEWCIIKNNHEAIISKELFDNAQINGKPKNKTIQTIDRTLFKGMLYCGHCKRTIKIESIANPSHYCNYGNGIKELGCYDLRIKHHILVDRVSEKLKKHIESLEQSGEIEQYFKIDNEVAKHSKEHLVRAVENLQEEKLNLFESKIDGKIDEEQFAEAMNNLNYTINEYKEMLKEIPVDTASKDDVTNNQYMDMLKKSNILTRKLVELFIEKIYISNDTYGEIHNIEIIYKNN